MHSDRDERTPTVTDRPVIRLEWNAPKRTKTICHECEGDGWVYRPSMYLGADSSGTCTSGTMANRVACKTCEGKGRLPGQHPPM